MEIFNNLQNEEIFKDFQPKKEKTFLNKKRNISKDAIDTPDSFFFGLSSTKKFRCCFARKKINLLFYHNRLQ